MRGHTEFEYSYGARTVSVRWLSKPMSVQTGAVYMCVQDPCGYRRMPFAVCWSSCGDNIKGITSSSVRARALYNKLNLIGMLLVKTHGKHNFLPPDICRMITHRFYDLGSYGVRKQNVSHVTISLRHGSVTGYNKRSVLRDASGFSYCRSEQGRLL